MHTILMNMDQTGIPVRYRAELNCSEDSLQNTITEVASFVSKIYAKFPLLQGEEKDKLTKQGVLFNKTRDLPSASECEEFEKALKQRMIRVLSEKRDFGSSISLTTDYFPENELCTIAKSVFGNRSDLGFFFPYKTHTWIDFKDENTKLCVEMNFKFPALSRF